jgi:hypothetical protein
MYRNTERLLYYDSFLYLQIDNFLQHVSHFSACYLATVLVSVISVLFSVVGLGNEQG